jgi:hypothetical protein
MIGVRVPSEPNFRLGSSQEKDAIGSLSTGRELAIGGSVREYETEILFIYLEKEKKVARNLKNLADEYEDNDDDYFEKLTRKPKYSKKTREVEIRKQRQAKERARKSSMRQYEDYYEED